MKRLLLTILFCLFLTNAYAVTQLKRTVMPSGGDYTSLEACMNANEQNLVTADKYFDVEIDGTWSSADTTAVTIHNYTTDATRYINIYTTATARHNGTAQAVSGLSSYRIDLVGQAAINGITISNSNITIKDIELVNISESYTFNMGIATTTYFENIFIVNNIIHNIGLGSDRGGYGIKGYRVTSGLIANNIIYKVRMIGIEAGLGVVAVSLKIYNNTIYDFTKAAVTGMGINLFDAYVGSTGEAKNNLVIAGATGTPTCYIVGTNWTVATNGGSDTTGDIDNMTAADLFVDTTAGSEDLHLKAGADAIDVGTDLSAVFTTDIDGTTRPTGANTWDIGADEYVAAATGYGWVNIINN